MLRGDEVAAVIMAIAATDGDGCSVALDSTGESARSAGVRVSRGVSA